MKVLPSLVVMIILLTKQSMHRPKTSFKDSHLNNTMMTVNKGQELTLNCRVARKQVKLLADFFCIHELCILVMYVERKQKITHYLFKLV